MKFHKAYVPYKIRNREKSIWGKQKLISKCIRKTKKRSVRDVKEGELKFLGKAANIKCC